MFELETSVIDFDFSCFNMPSDRWLSHKFLLFARFGVMNSGFAYIFDVPPFPLVKDYNNFRARVWTAVNTSLDDRQLP